MRNIHHKRVKAGWVAAMVTASTIAYMAIAGSGSAATRAAPVNTAPPTISGTPTVGQMLTASDGTWSNSPTSFAYQWLRCNTSGGSCVNVANGTLTTSTAVGAHRRRSAGGADRQPPSFDPDLLGSVSRADGVRTLPDLRRLVQERDDHRDGLAAWKGFLHTPVRDARRAGPVRRVHAALEAGGALPRPRSLHGHAARS